MSTKQNSPRSTDEATQVFRQFAWHLAGSLAAARVAASGNVRAAKGAGKGTGKR